MGVTREQLDRILDVSFFRSMLNGMVERFGEGRCQVRMPVRPEHRQFLGAARGGIVGALADDACAWACASVVGELVTASYSINLMARGHLLKAGKRIVVGRAEIYSVQAGQEKLVAVFLATLAPVHARRK